MSQQASPRDRLVPPSLDAFWGGAAGPLGQAFDPASLPASLPDEARRYLTHAIRPGTHLATAVRVRMRGEIKLKRWLPFTATQVIAPAVGMRWQARVGRFPVVVSGFDVVHQGRGAMRWRLLGIVPLVTSTGPDIDKASIARLQVELVWLPSALLPHDGAVIWSEDAQGRTEAACTHFDWTTRLRFGLETDGRLSGIDLERWGHPDPEAAPVLYPYGARVEAEETFHGYTIPTKLRVAWAHAGDEAFSETEYFRCEILEAEFRT